MKLFDRKPKPENSAPKPQMTVAIDVKERQTFEQLCEDLQIEFSVQLAPDGLYDYTYDVDRDPEISKHFLPVPPKEGKNQPSLNSKIDKAMGKSTLPANPLTKVPATAEKKPFVKPQLQKPADSPSSPTALENRWAEEKMAKELQEIERETKEADALLVSSQEPAADAVGKQRKKRKSLGRTNQIKTRLTDSELVQFQRRVKKSGLSQGDFLRRAALTDQIVIEDHSIADVAMLDELAMIRAELGRQGGLLKMIIKPNEGQRELAPEEWAELIASVRDMERMKKRLSDLEVRVQHGNRKAQDQ